MPTSQTAMRWGAGGGAVERGVGRGVGAHWKRPDACGALLLSLSPVTAQEHLFVSPLWNRPIQNAGGLAELTGGAEVVAKTYPPLLPSPFPG